MRQSFDLSRVAALRCQARAEYDKALAEAANRHLSEGLPVEEIQQAIECTDWRYVLENCGDQIELSRLSDLKAWYFQLVDQIEENLEGILQVSEVQGSPKAMLRLLEAREALGRHCHEVHIDGLRVQRFLLPEDEPPAPVLDIQRVLARVGLTWDGGFEVEGAPGENAKLFTDACVLMGVRDVSYS